jgi:deoxyribose-phosphate aldolase
MKPARRILKKAIDCLRKFANSCLYIQKNREEKAMSSNTLTLTGLPAYLVTAISQVRNVKGDAGTADLSLQCLDLTTLGDNDDAAKVISICNKALYSRKSSVAGICIFPEFVGIASKRLSKYPTFTAIATVINFPHGDKVTSGTLGINLEAVQGNTDFVVSSAIAEGATEIDIVLDYKSFLNGDKEKSRALLTACKDACRTGNAIMKVIVESAAFDKYEDLKQACELAIECMDNGDFLKTSTGKYILNGKGQGATPETGAVLLEAAASSDKKIGVKISGGVKTNDDCARYTALARSIAGDDFVKPVTFRFGASGVYDDLVKNLNGPKKMQQPAAPSGPSLDY